MSEIAPAYIPCAAGTRTQTDFLIRPCPYDSALIEILGHPIMDIMPQDARKAAFALLAMADRADGLKTPYVATEAFEALLDAADNLVTAASWFPSDSVGTPEMLVITGDVTALSTALEAFSDEN